MDYTSEPETEFAWERKPHPMCIPHIVDSILNHLSVSDLKSCRLVSSQYNEIACKALQREETIVFKTMPQLETYVAKIKPISLNCGACHSSSLSLCSDLSSLSTEYDEGEQHYGEKNGTDDDDDCWSCLNHNNSNATEGNNNHCDAPDSASSCHFDHEDCYYNSLYRYSHRNFHFDYCDPSTSLDTIDQFFQTFGAQIQSLKYTTDLLPYNFPKLLGHMGDVWQNRLGNLEELVLEMKWGVPAHLFAEEESPEERTKSVLLPKLRTINLDILLTDRDADRAQVFISELLSVTPDIEEISIPGSKRYFDDYINCVLARAIISSNVSKLSVLNFCLALSDAQMRLLTHKNLPLSTLILDLEDLQFEEDNNDNLQQQPNNNDDNNDGDGEDNDAELRPEFFRQNQNRRPSFTPIVKSTLMRFMYSLAATLRSLHICFPQSPRHNLHTFTFQQDMVELRFLALGYYAGPSRILDHLPALKKLELWNVQFRDCHGNGKVVPDKYQGITSVIS